MAMTRLWQGRLAAGILGAALAVAGCDTSSVLPEPAVEAPSPWQVINPRPFAVQIFAMWGDSPDHVMAVGGGGAVLVKEGPAWREAPRPTTATLFDVHGCDWQHIYALSREGVHFFDGRHWTRTGPDDLDSLDRIWCRAPDDVLLVGRNGLSHHFDGRAWTRQDLPVGTDSIEGHWLTGTRDGYHVVGHHGYAAQWRHGRWEEPLLIDDDISSIHGVCRAVDPDGPERILVSAGSRIHAFSQDRGWEELAGSYGWGNDLVSGGGSEPAYIFDWDGDRSEVRTLTGEPVGSVEGRVRGALLAFPAAAGGGDRLVFAGRFGTIAEGYDDGGGLVRIAGGVPATVTSFLVWPDGGFTGFNAWAGAVLQGSSDGELSLLPEEGPRTIEALWGPAQDQLYGVGYGGRVVLLKPGREPEELAPTGSNRLNSIWGTADGELWVGGWEEAWRGDGTAWESLDFEFSGYVDGILGHGPDDVYLVEQDRVLHWDGSAVSVLHEGSYVYANTAIPAPDGRGIFCAVEPRTGGQFLFPALRRLAPGGGESYVVFPGTPRGLVALEPGSFLAATHMGLFRLENGAWIEMAHPTTDRGGSIACLGGSREAGIYTFSNDDVIHHLDSGGSGLWR